MKFIISILLFLIYSIFIFTDNYNVIYVLTMLILFLLFTIKNIFVKILSFFYILYFGLSTLNISTYRGVITAETLKLYSMLIILSIIPFIILKQKKSIIYTKITLTKMFYDVSKIHLLIVYASTIYVFLAHGNVLINQAARFYISPSLGYIIKSSLIIPLFYPFIENKSKQNIILYLILPILPSIFIGSRGNILVLLGAYLLINSLSRDSKTIGYLELIKNKALDRKRLIKFGAFGFSLLFIFYYIRRVFNSELLSADLILKTYNFPSNSWIYLIILPFYTAFRETIGISNVIITNKIINTSGEIPLFFSELFTILPGEHVAPGRVLGQEVIGSTLDGGLTPGILGGLYIDFGWFSIFGGIIITAVISIFYIKSKINSYSLICFSLCFVQYIHLFHRGFLKVEYFTYLFLVIFYFLFTRKSYIKNR